MIIVSACLAGVKCRYDGQSRECGGVIELVKQGKALPLCPEVMGGRKTPRPAVEITGGGGEDVLAGRAKIREQDGTDVTGRMTAGADSVLATAIKMGVKSAILKDKSPACGFGRIYDGTFSKKLVKGNGVLAAAFIKNGIKVYNEDNYKEILDTL